VRRTKTITLDDRGNKRAFRIEEMPATELESWAIQAALALSVTLEVKPDDNLFDLTVLEDVIRRLFAGGLGRLSLIDYNKVKPLYDKLLLCCYRLDGGVEQRCEPETIDGYIEDVKTLFALRAEALKLNFSFFPNAAPSDSRSSSPIINIPRNSQD
jgi:hypothetical protein